MNNTPRYLFTIFATIATIGFAALVIIGKDTQDYTQYLMMILPTLASGLGIDFALTAKRKAEKTEEAHEVSAQRLTAVEYRLDLMCMDKTCPVRVAPTIENGGLNA